MVASHGGHTEIVSLLLQHGADSSAKNKEGFVRFYSQVAKGNMKQFFC